MLFFYSQFTNLPLLYKCMLLSVSKYSTQQIITFNWIYSSISNFFFSFYILIKEITFSWLLKNRYYFNYSKKTNLYHTHIYEERQHFYFEYLFSITDRKISLNRNTKIDKMYNKWYEEWIKRQTSYDIWKSKKTALSHARFLKQICLNDINNIWKNKKMLHFKYLFLKLFYYINVKKKDPFFIDIEKTSFKDYDYINSKFLSYWRFVLYFKYFNNFFQIPDVLFSIFPDQNDLPLNEYSSINLVSIGLLDTNCRITNVHYPIISNDDSFIIVLFYFTLFSNIFLENQLNIYSYLK